ncbi:MAG: FAD-binding oxidoreductase, partial [Candidatus Hydrogenedentota bacterium]
LRAVLEFEDEFDTKLDFHRDGCIQTASTREDLAVLEGIARELAPIDVNVRMLEPYELIEFFPGLVIDDLLGAIYTPDDGHLDPHGMTQGYAGKARTLGVRILTRTPATGLKIRGGKIAGVKTPRGDIDTEMVVNAAGPMAAEVARFAGLQQFPVVPFKRQIFITTPTDTVAADAPFYFDMNPPFYFRPESGGLLMSIAELQESPEQDVSLDWSSVEILAERAMHRLPRLDSLQVMRGWAGLRSMTPDRTAILGPSRSPRAFTWPSASAAMA